MKFSPDDDWEVVEFWLPLKAIALLPLVYRAVVRNPRKYITKWFTNHGLRSGS